MTVCELADILDTPLVIRRRMGTHLPHATEWYANLDRVEVMENGLLASRSGNGETPHEALADLARVLSGVRVVVNAMGLNRRESNVPQISAGVCT